MSSPDRPRATVLGGGLGGTIAAYELREKIGSSAEIRLGRGPVPAGEGAGLVAREVIAEIGPRVEYPGN